MVGSPGCQEVENPPSCVELLPQPSVEVIPHDWEDFQPPSPAPDVELISPPSVEIIPQVE